MRSVVVIGGGAAGSAAADVLAAAGRPVVLLMNEDTPPYDRRPLSKGTLAADLPSSGPAARREVRTDLELHPTDWYTDHGIELRTDCAVRMIDRDRGEVITDDGDRIEYDDVIIATGAWPRSRPVAASDGEALYLRTWDDAVRLRDRLQHGGHLLIAGGGWIALEVAATARRLGLQVTVLHRGPDLLEGEVDAEAAERLRTLHVAHGVALHSDSVIDHTTRGSDGRYQVLTTDGIRHVADTVLVAIGAVPRTTIAEDCGLRVGDGILVDEYMRTADPHIYAAGDVCAAFHPLADRHVRVATWDHAALQGRTAAQAALGTPVPCTSEPVLTSVQFDTVIEARGFRGAYRVSMRVHEGAALSPHREAGVG